MTLSFCHALALVTLSPSFCHFIPVLLSLLSRYIQLIVSLLCSHDATLPLAHLRIVCYHAIQAVPRRTGQHRVRIKPRSRSKPAGFFPFLRCCSPPPSCRRCRRVRYLRRWLMPTIPRTTEKMAQSAKTVCVSMGGTPSRGCPDAAKHRGHHTMRGGLARNRVRRCVRCTASRVQRRNLHTGRFLFRALRAALMRHAHWCALVVSPSALRATLFPR